MAAADPNKPVVQDDPADLPPLGRALLWLDSASGVVSLVRTLGIVCVLLILAEFFIHRHPVAPLSGLPGFDAVFGFAAFTLVVLGARALRRLVQRPEDFYGASAVDSERYPPRGLNLRAHRRAGADDQTGAGS